MIFPTVTETTPRPEAVTPDPFLAGDLADRTATRAGEVTAVANRIIAGSPASHAYPGVSLT
jgi:hypothetical protein